jgi:hypothetical protein
MIGETAAPLTATAAGNVISRIPALSSKRSVGTMNLRPRSGGRSCSPSNIVPAEMPLQRALKVNGAQPRPDGTTPG